MTAALFPPILAVLTEATPAPAPTPDPSSPLRSGAPMATPVSQSIHDIAPPVDVFPYPMWMVVTAAVIAGLFLIFLIWLLVRWVRRRPAAPPLGPAAIALRELEKLRGRSRDTEPYEFSVAVSDVLRTFINDAKFRLPATRQTSPEFLAAIAGAPLFSEADRDLLRHFLEKCDLIKFARVQATSEDNSELVQSALAFVQGGRA